MSFALVSLERMASVVTDSCDWDPGVERPLPEERPLPFVSWDW